MSLEYGKHVSAMEIAQEHELNIDPQTSLDVVRYLANQAGFELHEQPSNKTFSIFDKVFLRDDRAKCKFEY